MITNYRSSLLGFNSISSADSKASIDIDGTQTDPGLEGEDEEKKSLNKTFLTWKLARLESSSASRTSTGVTSWTATSFSSAGGRLSLVMGSYQKSVNSPSWGVCCCWYSNFTSEHRLFRIIVGGSKPSVAWSFERSEAQICLEAGTGSLGEPVVESIWGGNVRSQEEPQQEFYIYISPGESGPEVWQSSARHQSCLQCWDLRSRRGDRPTCRPRVPGLPSRSRAWSDRGLSCSCELAGPRWRGGGDWPGQPEIISRRSAGRDEGALVSPCSTLSNCGGVRKPTELQNIILTIYKPIFSGYQGYQVNHTNWRNPIVL